MEKRIRNLALFLLCLTTFLLAGCVAETEEPTVKPAGKSRTDVTRTDNNPGGGWDDFPNKYKPTLLELQAKAGQLPAPLGTRYEFLDYTTKVGSKRAAPLPCTGDSTVFQYKAPGREFYLYDTISYHDSNGVAHCENPNPTAPRWSERHSRRIVEIGVGEAWETIHDSITEGDILPRHTIHGTGFIRMESGLELAIQSYDLILVTPFTADQAYVVNASLKLQYKDRYTILLELAKQHPYSVAEDFFPAESVPEAGPILSGPITHPADSGGVDTVGYFDLYDDRTVRIRDWAGDPLGR